jgi:hypothetical protein
LPTLKRLPIRGSVTDPDAIGLSLAGDLNFHLSKGQVAVWTFPENPLGLKIAKPRSIGSGKSFALHRSRRRRQLCHLQGLARPSFQRGTGSGARALHLAQATGRSTTAAYMTRSGPPGVRSTISSSSLRFKALFSIVASALAMARSTRRILVSSTTRSSAMTVSPSAAPSKK